MKDKEGLFCSISSKNLVSILLFIDKFRGFAFITFDDYDSVDRCILEKPHVINSKELDVRKAIPREQTSRFNGYNLNSHQLNTDFYPTHLMINHPTFSPPSYSSYPYFPSTNYLAKPMPLMGNTNSTVLSPPAFLLPTDLTTPQFFRNPTYPSPPHSTSSSTRINHNTTQYQNGNQIKPNNEQSSTINDPSKNQPANSFPTPIRTKIR
jgi:hypothetical protein